MTAIVIHRFSQCDSFHYRAYSEIKREVFGSASAEEPSGQNGHFLLATLTDRTPVGILRGVPLACGLAHRAALRASLHDPEVAVMLARLGTLSDLAVRAPFRGRDFCVVGSQWIGTAGKLLLLAMIRDLERLGMEAAIAAAAGPVAPRLCESVGFLPLDPPGAGPAPPNYGLVFGSPRHVNAERLCGMERDSAFRLSPEAERLQEYFRSCREQSDLAAAGRA
jgi:hypothetical protein